MYKKGRSWEKLYPKKFSYWNAEMVAHFQTTMYDRKCKVVHYTTVDKQEEEK